MVDFASRAHGALEADSPARGGRAYSSHHDLGERVRSGPLIPQLTALQHGDHFCSFYDSPREQLNIIAPFFKEALRRGEACLYVVDDRTVEEVTGALATLGVDARVEQERGALVFVSKSEWRNTGDFDLQRMREKACKP